MPLYYAPLYNFVTGNLNGSDVAYQNLTTGTDNAALGQGTLPLVTSGSNNIALGTNAAAVLTTGSNNVLLGISAGANITSGGGNVGINNGALFSCTTGNDNIGILSGMGNLTTGSENISLGTSALFNLVSGSRNVAVGRFAGSFISGFNRFGPTTGSDNTFIGNNTGFTTAADDFSFATAIGAGAQVAASNTITLGRSAGQDTVNMAGPLRPATPAGTTQALVSLYAGTGAPNNANGNNGDIYFNAAGGALTTIYQKRAGAWVGIV